MAPVQKTLAKNRKEHSLPSGAPGSSSLRMQLLDAVNRHICSSSRLSETVEQIVQTTQTALRAEASSVLLLDDSGSHLSFHVAEGAKASRLKHVTVGLDSGIAGWVATHKEPAIVNNVRADSRFTGEVDKSIGFVTRSVMCVPLVVHSSSIGVLEVLNKRDGSGFTEQDLECLEAVAATAAIAIENTRLQQKVEQGYKATMRSLAAAIDAKDPYTRGHSQRVVDYSVLAAVALGLSHNEVDVIEQAAILHDVGKIGIDDRILSKPDRLTTEERLIVQEHPIIGAAIVADIPFLADARELLIHHHERLDGSGYPHRLAGDDIPLGARILAVADAFDTMVTDRPYRSALPVEQAVAELRRCSGSQFDERVVEAFLGGLQTRATV